jgi:hypothetical protein
MHALARASALATLALAACGDGPPNAAARAAAPAAAPAAAATPPVPATDRLVERSLATMQARVGPAPARLADAAPTREALMRRYLGALARRDPRELDRLLVTPAEFAHLYFPTSMFRRPPTALEADVVWTQMRAQSQAGAGQALAVYGGRRLGYVGHRCSPEPVREGDNRLWDRCAVRFTRAPGDTVEQVLVTRVIERDGRFKALGYVSDL